MTTEKGGRPSSADDDRIALRRAEAVKLRAHGKTFQEIADTLSIGLATAHLDVRTAMTEIAKEAEENVLAERGTELSRLQRAISVVEDILGHLEPTGAEGDDDALDAIESSRELKLKALDRLVKIQDQRAKLLGLYAPEKKDVTARVASVALDELDALKAAVTANESDDIDPAANGNGPNS